MKQSKKSGLLALIIILVVVLAVATIVCGTILIISPKLEIFGISWKTTFNEKYLINKVGENTLDASYDKIQIDALAYNVIVKSDNEYGVDGIGMELVGYYSGFYKKSSVETPFIPSAKEVIEDDIKIAKISVNTPSGLAFKNGGEVVVHIPSSYYKTYDIKLEIITTSGSITVGGRDTVNKIELTELVAKSKSGNVTVESYALINGDATVGSGKGQINFMPDSDSNFSKFTLVGGLGKLIVDNELTADEFVLSGSYVDYKLNKLNGDLNTGDVSGRVCIEELNGDLKGDGNASADITIKKINGNINLQNTTLKKLLVFDVSGNVSINDSGRYSVDYQKGIVYEDELVEKIVNKQDKEINIRNCSGDVHIETNKGLVALAGTSKNVFLRSVAGKVVVDRLSAKNIYACTTGRANVEGILYGFEQCFITSERDLNVGVKNGNSFLLKIDGCKKNNFTYGDKLDCYDSMPYDKIVSYSESQLESLRTTIENGKLQIANENAAAEAEYNEQKAALAEGVTIPDFVPKVYSYDIKNDKTLRLFSKGAINVAEAE